MVVSKIAVARDIAGTLPDFLSCAGLAEFPRRPAHGTRYVNERQDRRVRPCAVRGSVKVRPDARVYGMYESKAEALG